MSHPPDAEPIVAIAVPAIDRPPCDFEREMIEEIAKFTEAMQSLNRIKDEFIQRK